jgi:hypothetical protein
MGRIIQMIIRNLDAVSVNTADVVASLIVRGVLQGQLVPTVPLDQEVLQA